MATLVLTAVLSVSFAPLAHGQVAREGQGSTTHISRDDAPLVYVDCDGCDMRHVRREITFVNHVRDPNLAEVHVLITDQSTGSGGRLYTLAFAGRPPFDGAENTLRYASEQSNTEAEERDGLTEMLKLGLVPYVAQTELGSQLAVSFEGASVEDAGQTTDDPWNNWTFELYGGTNFDLESNQGEWHARYGFYANRVTEDWKIRLRPYFNNRTRFVRQDGEELRIVHRRHGFDSFVIMSVGDHMGVGIFGDYITNTRDNIRHRFRVTPAVEYNLYPYSAASRRQITFTYRVGYEAADYFEETIYEQTAEMLANNSLEGRVEIQEPWGSISTSVTGSTYLHDTSFNRITVDGYVSFRIGSGLSLNVGGDYERINDQLTLPRGDASLEDIVLERRQLATAFRGRGNIGLSYTFGSIFSNVVNPRL